MGNKHNHKLPDYCEQLEKFLREEEDKKREALRVLKEAHSKILEANFVLFFARKSGVLESVGVGSEQIATDMHLLALADKHLRAETRALEKEDTKKESSSVLGHP